MALARTGQTSSTSRRPRGVGAQSPGQSGHPSLLFYVCLALACLGLAFWLRGSDPDRQAIASAITVIGLVGAVYIYQRTTGAASYCLNMWLISTLLGQLAFLLCGVSGLIGSIMIGGVATLADKPWVQMGYAMVSFVTLVVAARLFGPRPNEVRVPDSDFLQIQSDLAMTERVLLWCLPISALFPLMPLLPGPVGAMAKTFIFHVLFIPFFAGRYLKRGSMVKHAWVGFLIVNMIASLLIGGRFFALCPLLAFGVVLWLRLEPTSRAITGVLALLGAVPAVIFVGIFGIVRTELGRDEGYTLSAGHARKVWRTVEEVVNTSDEGMRHAVMSDGVTRLIPWANYAVPLLSPEPVPYRGFGTLGAEVVNTFMIYRFSSAARERLFSLGMHGMAANDYGFAVGEGFAVEWSILADGWSRGGIGAGVAFLMLGGAVIFALERWLVRTRIFRPAFKIVLYAVLLGRLQIMETIPLLEFLRQTILAVAVYAGILYTIQMFITRRARISVGPAQSR